MKVVHVVNDLEVGGAQTLIEALAAASSGSAAVDLVVLAGRGTLSPRLESVCHRVTYLGMTRTASSARRARAGLAASLAQSHPDVVHSHLVHSDVLSLSVAARGWKRVTTVHSTGFGPDDPLLSKLLARYTGLRSRQLDGIVACAASALPFLRSFGYRTVDAVIPNGIALPAAVPPLPVDGQARTVLHLARWHPMKDHANLFAAYRRACAEGAVLRLVCAGSGVSADNPQVLDALARAGLAPGVAPGQVELLGALAHVEDVLDACSALVISSSYGEALPMAGLEALARGRPVVTTDVGDCRSLTVRDDLLVPPGDPASLGAALRTVALMERAGLADLATASSDAARRRFDISLVVEQYGRLYERVLAS